MTSLDSLATCKPRSATLILVEEALLTRTRLTEASAAVQAAPIEFGPGDARLPRLQAILAAAAAESSPVREIDPRTLVRLTCEDGSEVSVAGAATDPDGHMYMLVGDRPMMTKMPLRRQLEALAAG